MAQMAPKAAAELTFRPMQSFKENYVGAVTMVHFSASGELLYVGMGADLAIYDVARGVKLASQRVLANGTLHGIDTAAWKDGSGVVGVFFGQKKLIVLKNLPQHTHQIAVSSRFHWDHVGQLKHFHDWIFDCQLLTQDDVQSPQSPLLAVGLAHNFVQLWDPVHDNVLQSIQCTERCILYSLAFHGRSWQQLVVASGTVYQQILLWKPVEDDASPKQRLHGHDGVIFKLRWSDDGSLLASVSDDRTVQLWSSREPEQFQAYPAQASTHALLPSTQTTREMLQNMAAASAAASAVLSNPFRSVFRGWGHTARVWDVQFCAFGLASCSEDSECKVWDFGGACVATIQGHVGKHVWCLAVHPDHNVIATGGGDAAVKLWELMHQMTCTAPNSARSCREISLLPAVQAGAQASHQLDQDSNEQAPPPPQQQQSSDTRKKKKGGKSLKKNAVLSIRDVALNRQSTRAFAAMDSGKLVQVDLTDPSSVPIVTHLTRKEDDQPLIKGSISCIELDAAQENVVVGDTSGGVHVVATGSNQVRATLQAHRTRIFKIWCLPQEEHQNENTQTLFTCSIDGILKEWKWQPNAATEDHALELVAAYQSPRKSSTCCLLAFKTSRGISVLIGGDGRGNVYLFHRVDTHQAQDPEQIHEATTGVWNVHGRDHVSCVVHDRTQGLVVTGGHDGYMCSFVVEDDDDNEAESSVRLKLIRRASIKGLATIKHMWLTENRQHEPTGGVSSELFVFGFHSTQAILHNFTSEYRVLSVECGGWRRPHAFHMGFRSNRAQPDAALPWHSLVFASTDSTSLNACLAVHSSSSQAPATSFAKCSLNSQLHGRMITSVTWLRHGDDEDIAGRDRNPHLCQSQLLVTGSEDNSIKLLQRSRSPNANLPGWEVCCVATGTAHTTGVRALTSFEWHPSVNHKRSINVIVSGGGKQSVNVWKVLKASKPQPMQLHHVASYEPLAASQDHRILGLAAFQTSPESPKVLVVASNSEGRHRVLLVDLELESTRELSSFHCSKKPILCCEALQLANGQSFFVTGSTDGMVTVWDLTEVLLRWSRQGEEDQIYEGLAQLKPCVSYLAHDFGANCLCVRKAVEDNDHSFWVLSGGDDQSLHAARLAIVNRPLNSSLEMTTSLRQKNASGSAIKTIQCDRDFVYLAGYDQRVSVWKLQAEDSKQASVLYHGAVFTECADIADMAVASSVNGGGDVSVVVVGQGLQQMRFHHEQ